MEDRQRSGLGWGVFLWKRSENDDIIINKRSENDDIIKNKGNGSLMEVQL